MNVVPPANWLFRLAYDGSGFHGWQEQPGQRTVQGVFQDRLSKLFASAVQVFGCSRTDAGVHALAQGVTFRPPAWPPIALTNVCRALRSSLPEDVRLVNAWEKPEGFHARFQALGKAYTYLIYPDYLKSPFWHKYCLEYPQALELDAMVGAAGALVGRHDFRNFSVTAHDERNLDTVRQVHGIAIHTFGKTIAITIIANGFLYRMARRIVGFLLAVGRGRLPPEAGRILLEKPTTNAGFDTAPAMGLYLVEVFYEEADRLAFQPRQLPLLSLLQLPEVESKHVT